MTAVNVRKTALFIQGQDTIHWYRSSNKVDRGFCSICGCALFWRPDIEDYKWISVAMGLFDQSTGQKLAKHTCVREKGDCYELSDGIPQTDGY